jgi:hypothetical protein
MAAFYRMPSDDLSVESKKKDDNIGNLGSLNEYLIKPGRLAA